MGNTVAPVGTVTMLFTDIEGSTVLARTLGDAWPGVLARHHEIVGAAIAEHRGRVEATDGDAFFAVFSNAGDAARAAIAAQRALRCAEWPGALGSGPLVRMGLHTGAIGRGVTGLLGLEIHRAARVGAAAHGGQVLLTEAAVAAAGDAVSAEDLGLHRLKDFPAPEALYCAVIDGVGAAAFPPPRSLQVRPTNLPADERALIGRSGALAAIVEGFREERARLLTLTGLGGVGKTRLAIAAGTALLDDHPGGVWWVPLASTVEATGVLTALVSALAMSDHGERPLVEMLAERLGARPALVVLDNLEQIPDAGPVLTSLLDAVPALRILATSRLPLQVSRERVLAVTPLDPDASRELVSAVAARVRPDLQLENRVLADLDHVCARLDHHPLALELAAARLAVLSPAQLRDRVTRSLDLLRTSDRDRPERHRSLRATLDWSLALLDPGPRALFTRLGAFAAEAALDDLEAVFGDAVLDDMAALIDAGVLRRRDDGSGLRFALPQALRFIALEELAAAADGALWRRRHAERVAEALWQAEAGAASTAEEFEKALGMDAEARQALAWASTADELLAERIAAARAAQLSDIGRVREANDLADGVLASDAPKPRVRALALCARAHAGLIVADSDRIGPALAEAIDLLAEDDPLRGHALTLLGMDAGVHRGDHSAARAAFAAALSLADAIGNQALGTYVLAFLAQDQLVDGDATAAWATLDKATALAAASGAKAAWYLDTLRGDVALALGRGADAVDAHLRSALAALRRGDELQAFFDLRGIAESLAAAGCGLAAVEALGLAEGLAAEMNLADDVHWKNVLAEDHLEATRLQLGDAAAPALAAGRGVPAERRGVRARELAAAVHTPRPSAAPR